eukprot:6323686-Lingulodinium_polyedra.AAC.1
MSGIFDISDSPDAMGRPKHRYFQLNRLSRHPRRHGAAETPLCPTSPTFQTFSEPWDGDLNLSGEDRKNQKTGKRCFGRPTVLGKSDNAEKWK